MKQNNYELLTGATKSIPLNALPEEAWSVVRGSETASGNRTKIKQYFDTVSILNRCVGIRAGAMSAMPWSVSRGDKPFYTSGEGPLPPELAWMRKFKRQLYLYEASLLLYARAYGLIEGYLPSATGMDPEIVAAATTLLKSQGLQTDIVLRWLVSTSITPRWDIEDGITGFTRTVARDDVRELPVERVCFFDMPNPNSEIDAATSPVAAALITAKIMDSINDFSLKFIDRGAIKATILRVDQTTPPKERERIRTWWREFMSGVKRAWTSEVLSTAVEPVVIGEGLADVLNPTITRAQAEDMATALGIPHALLFSNSANFATALSDERNLYTYAIMPDAEMIEEEINLKLFERLGFKFSFEPASLRSFQENEKERADTFKVYTDSGVPHGIAAQIAGVELPDGIAADDLDALIMEQKQANMAMAQQNAAAMSQASGKVDTQGRQDAPSDAAPKDKQKSTSDKKVPPVGAPAAKAQKSADTLFADDLARFRRWLSNRLSAKSTDPWRLSDFASEVVDASTKAAIFAEMFAPEADDTPLFDELWHEHDDGAKALILQSNPDDDEAEQADIIKVENKMVGQLASALDAQKQAVFEGNEGNMAETNDGVDMSKLVGAATRVEAVSGARGAARDALRAALIEGADLGVRAANKQFDSIGFGFNWTLANEKARDWADKYSGDLITGIDATTLRGVRQSIAQWVQNGEPLSKLDTELATIFGRQRARLIASTEVTRSYATANQISYRESGIVKKIQWRTAVGERVCPICGGLHNKTAPLDEGFSGVVIGGLPPAHPRCRCWIVPVVDTNSIGVLNDNVGDGSTAQTQ